MLERDGLIEAIQGLLNGRHSSSADIDRCLTEIENSVPHPNVSDLIFYPQEPMTAEQIADAALTYEPSVTEGAAGEHDTGEAQIASLFRSALT